MCLKYYRVYVIYHKEIKVYIVYGMDNLYTGFEEQEQDTHTQLNE